MSLPFMVIIFPSFFLRVWKYLISLSIEFVVQESTRHNSSSDGLFVIDILVSLRRSPGEFPLCQRVPSLPVLGGLEGIFSFILEVSSVSKYIYCKKNILVHQIPIRKLKNADPS
jgi:hypothetical protein